MVSSNAFPNVAPPPPEVERHVPLIAKQPAVTLIPFANVEVAVVEEIWRRSADNPLNVEVAPEVVAVTKGMRVSPVERMCRCAVADGPILTEFAVLFVILFPIAVAYAAEAVLFQPTATDPFPLVLLL